VSLPSWARIIVLLAGTKAALGLVIYLAGIGEVLAPSVVPVWVYAAITCAFGVVGGLLVGGNRSDPRAAWLGGVLVLIAAALAPGVNRASTGVVLVSLVRPDALLPAFFWRFVAEFPSRLSGTTGRVVRQFATAALALGTLALLANLSTLAWPLALDNDWRGPLVVAAPRGGWYWGLTLGVSALALPVLLWRARSATPAERPRVRIFVRGLALGLTPFALEVLAESASASYHAFSSRAVVREVIGAVLFGSLALVPFVTAYSVLFDRVVETRVVLRAALQHMLARYSIVMLAGVPFVALAVVLYSQRDQALTTIFAGPRPLLMLGAAGLGLVAQRMRARWLDAVDRRYFREPYDAQQILARFVGDLQSENVEQLAARITDELERSLHVPAALFIANDAGTALRDVQGGLPALAASATLVDLLASDANPMDLDLSDPASTLQRLPDGEKRWIAATGARLLVVLKRADGDVTGVLVLAEKRSGLAFTRIDRQLISAVASAATLALDNLRLRSTTPSPSAPPAQECLECSRLNPADALQCGCGGALTEAPVPHLLRGTFRLEQRLGAGGMGVVYRAVDLQLGRDVAIKTLPAMASAAAARLRKEARAMAMVAHPNLATVYGIETWRDVPFLIEEYLAAGTLSKRLALVRPSLNETIQLGITLADALEHLHAARLLHCDIKPSNIGFTQQGVVKLVDFGLARLLRDARPPSEVITTADPSASPPALVAVSASGAFSGTPPYMSPEAVQGAPPTAAFDVWSLSVVLFEALAGRRPFEGDTGPEIFARVLAPDRPDLTRFWPECPPPVAELFVRLLALDPQLRPSGPGALRRLLQALRPVAQLI
jgi:hypothetical protein